MWTYGGVKIYFQVLFNSALNRISPKWTKVLLVTTYENMYDVGDNLQR
jgi:hypothetical protein